MGKTNTITRTHTTKKSMTQKRTTRGRDEKNTKILSSKKKGRREGGERRRKKRKELKTNSNKENKARCLKKEGEFGKREQGLGEKENSRTNS